MAYRYGLFAGMLFGLVAAAVLVALLCRKKILDMHFDERQELARGKAFQYGFFALIGSLYVYGFSDLLLGRWCDPVTGVTLCVAVGMCVFAVVCILKDAYLSLREKPRQIMTLFALIAAVNLGLGAMYHISPGLVENGVLTYRAVNPILGAAVLVILAVYIVNCLLRPRGEAE